MKEVVTVYPERSTYSCAVEGSGREVDERL